MLSVYLVCIHLISMFVNVEFFSFTMSFGSTAVLRAKKLFSDLLLNKKKNSTKY